MHNRTRFIFFLLSLAALSLYAGIGATVHMLNGDALPCEIQTEYFSVVNNLGEMFLPADLLAEIRFPEAFTVTAKQSLTEIRTVYGEVFRGFVTNESITLLFYGGNMDIRRGKISKILFQNAPVAPKEYQATVTLRNGDLFYGNLMENGTKIQTSYGIVELPFKNMKRITFEGSGNVLSKLEMIEGGTLQGVIKSDYLSFSLLTGIEISVVPDLILNIVFAR